jgi:hypothetical protein
MKRKWTLFFLLLNFCLWADAEVGKVSILQGTATAAQPKEKERTLQEGSPIFVKDTIQTASDSMIQIQFKDKTILDLTPNTRYAIKNYQYGKTLSKDQSQTELIQGGFRLLSGSIKPDPDRYNVETPNATIGLLGTLLEAQMSEEVLYVSCTQGRVQIKNEEGTVVIGEGMEQYAVVTSYSRRPRIFINPPSNMIRPTIRP